MGFYFRTPPLFPFLIWFGIFSISLDRPNSPEKVSCCPHKCWQHNWPQPLMRGRLNQRRGTTVMLLVVFLPPTRHNIVKCACCAFLLGTHEGRGWWAVQQKKTGGAALRCLLTCASRPFYSKQLPPVLCPQPPTLKGMLFNIEGASLWYWGLCHMHVYICICI